MFLSGLIAAAADDGWRLAGTGEAPTVAEPVREFRGVWIATVYNLDWPSKPGLPVDVQKAELLEILDGAASLHLNAVVLQVRTMCDAFYASPLEPWSYYLTGELGKAPEPFWDPLEFAVAEAHARGLELHAWFNPFRATTAEYGGVMPENHITRQYPWVARPSGRHLWLDPSSDFVRQRVITAIYDVVSRYDVDAVHMDDYFYPYPAKGVEPNFPDDENWERYRLGEGLASPDGPLSREDWRRGLVNGLIRDLYADIKRAKPWVKLGLSPFGIWRPGHPQGIAGMDAYANIFADSRKWLREGWVDYFSPQLYWKITGPQDFVGLHGWWQDQNIHGRHLWPGMGTSRIGRGGEADGRGVNEIFGQIQTTRDQRGKSPGSGQIHWHWEAFITNRGGIRKLITAESYRDRAISPPSPWLAKLETDPQPLPRVAGLKVAQGQKKDENGEETRTTEWSIGWTPADGALSACRWWLLQTGKKAKKTGEWTWQSAPLAPGDWRTVHLDTLDGVDALSLRAVDAYGQLGPASVWLRDAGED